MNEPEYLILAASQGDDLARAALEDLHEEGRMHSPFQAGKSYVVCLNTLYYVGRVAEVAIGWIRLESASWVHWTGRLSTLLSRQSFAHANWPAGEQKPRTEYVGDVFLFVGTNGAAAYPWTGPLPKESVR